MHFTLFIQDLKRQRPIDLGRRVLLVEDVEDVDNVGCLQHVGVVGKGLEDGVGVVGVDHGAVDLLVKDVFLAERQKDRK